MCRSQSSPPASDLLWRVPGLRSMLFWFSSRVVFVLQAVHLLYSQHICCSKNRKQKIFHYVILLHTTGIMMTHSQPNILQYYSIYRYNTYFHYSEFFLRVCYYRLLKMSESWLCNITFRHKLEDSNVTWTILPDITNTIFDPLLYQWLQMCNLFPEVIIPKCLPELNNDFTNGNIVSDITVHVTHVTHTWQLFFFSHSHPHRYFTTFLLAK